MSDANLSDSDIVNSGSQTFRSFKRELNPEDSAHAAQPTFLSRPKVSNQIRMQQSPLISTDRTREKNTPSQPFNNSKRAQTDDKGNRTLALMHKGLCKLPPMISEKLSSIKILDLSHNKFEYFPIEVTQVPELQILRLNFNYIKRVPAEVSKLISLEILSLSHNRLQHLPSTLPQLTALKGLHLESNCIESFGVEITNLQNLECLNIYHNKLQSLPTTFKNLKNLRELRFEWLRYLGSASCYWRAEDDSHGLTKLRYSCEQLMNNGRQTINFADFVKLFCRDKGQEIDLMYRDKYGCTLLHQACLSEDIGVIQHLLSAAPMLIDLPDSQNRTPLCYSILKDKHKSSNFLLKHGANPTKQCGSEGSPIHIAVRKLNIDIVRGILRLGEKANRADPDGNTPLHYAITMMHEDQEKTTQIIEDLLDHGADPNLKNNEGWTPLHIAVRKRDIKTIEWALSYNFGTLEVCGRNEVFDLNIGGGPHNWTTMHIAAYSENPELVEMLGEAGANMFAKSLNGYTAKKVVGKPGLVLKLVTKYERDFIKKQIIDQQPEQRFITPRERIPTQIVANLHGGTKPVSNVSRNLFGNNYDFGGETRTNTGGNDHPDFSINSNLKNFLTPYSHSRNPSHASTPFGAETRINMHITMTETKQLFIRRYSEESSEILPESEINTISHSIEDIDASHPEFCGSEFNESAKFGTGSLSGNLDRKIMPTKNIKNKLTETLARITIRNDQGSSNSSLAFSQGNIKEISTAVITPSEIFDTQKYETYLKSGLRSGFEFWDRQAKFLEQSMLKEEVSFIERLRILSAFKIFQKVLADCAKKNPELLTAAKTSIFSLPERSYSLQEKDSMLKTRKEPSKTDKYLDLTLRSLVNVFSALKNDVPANVSLKMHICRFIGDAKLSKAVTFLRSVAANTTEPVVIKVEASRVVKDLEMIQKPEFDGPSLIKGFRPGAIKDKRDGFQDKPLMFNVDKTSMAPFPVKRGLTAGVIKVGR